MHDPETVKPDTTPVPLPKMPEFVSALAEARWVARESERQQKKAEKKFNRMVEKHRR